MSYEITVTKHGKALLQVDKASLRNLHDAESCFNLMCQKFPEWDGYSVEVFHSSLGEREKLDW